MAFTRSTIIKITAGLLGLVLVGIILFFAWLTLAEYKPAGLEPVAVERNSSVHPGRGKAVDIYTWNIGYASLDWSQDFFMDGGRGVRPATDMNVSQNIWAVQAFLSGSAADIVFFQEVDTKARRSYGVDQAEAFAGIWNGSAAFACNFRAPFIPYPFPRFTGRVESGILTLNSFAVSKAERIALPVAFDWPVRLCQLKRCLLVERVPVQNSEADLVLINFHLEAYSSEASRSAQTQVLLDFLLAEYAKGSYCVAGGDFNQSFPGAEEAFPLIEKEFFVPGRFDASFLPEGWTLATDITAPSCRLLNRPWDGTNQVYVIDGFILSPNVEPLEVKTVDLGFRNSDHNPVKLSFILK